VSVKGGVVADLDVPKYLHSDNSVDEEEHDQEQADIRQRLQQHYSHGSFYLI